MSGYARFVRKEDRLSTETLHATPLEVEEPRLWGLVGNTPLIPVNVQTDRGDGHLWIKAEWLNPGGSVKDRPAREILRAGLRTGGLATRRLLDASSGNTAVAYAMLGAAVGVGITVCVPRNVSAERRQLLKAYGADVVETDPLEGSDGAIRVARGLAADEPDRFWYADQYSNRANPLAHYRSTGPEIWRDTCGAVTHLVAGVGTSGTLTGTAAYLRERKPELRVISVEPDGPFHGLEGLKHMASAIVPPIYDPTAIDDRRFVATEAADARVVRLAREHGLFVGWSAGAALVVGEQILEHEIARGASPVIVVVAPDGGTRYLSETERL